MKKPLNNYVWDNEKRIKAIQETADNIWAHPFENNGVMICLDLGDRR